MQDDDWLDIKQCAEEIHVSHMTIRRLIASGELVAHKFGRQWRVRRSDWERYIASTKRDSSLQ